LALLLLRPAQKKDLCRMSMAELPANDISQFKEGNGNLLQCLK
jgi:hypothetical protein